MDRNDCNRRFGEANVAVVETFNINGGPDFG